MNLWQTRTRIMVAVGLNTSNHLTGIVRRIARHCRVSAPTNRSSCFSLSFVLNMSYLRLTYVAMFLAALFLIQAFISPFKRLTKSISAPLGLKRLLKPIAQTLSAPAKAPRLSPRRLMLETAIFTAIFCSQTGYRPRIDDDDPNGPQTIALG